MYPQSFCLNCPKRATCPTIFDILRDPFSALQTRPHLNHIGDDVPGLGPKHLPTDGCWWWMFWELVPSEYPPDIDSSFIFMSICLPVYCVFILAFNYNWLELECLLIIAIYLLYFFITTYHYYDVIFYLSSRSRFFDSSPCHSLSSLGLSWLVDVRWRESAGARRTLLVAWQRSTIGF